MYVLQTRESWAKYHIALFHTLLIIPNTQLGKTNYGYNISTNTKIAETLKGVDLAIVGDCHMPLGQFTIRSEDWSTIMIVPGSLTNTDASEFRRHTSVHLPLLTIDDESNVAIGYEKFDLRTNMLTFEQKNVERSLEKMRTLGGKPIEQLHPECFQNKTILKDDVPCYYSLNAFMRSQQYTKTDMDLVKAVLQNPDGLEKMIILYTEGQEGVIV